LMALANVGGYNEHPRKLIRYPLPFEVGAGRFLAGRGGHYLPPTTYHLPAGSWQAMPQLPQPWGLVNSK
jgi:hypothetical protein